MSLVVNVAEKAALLLKQHGPDAPKLAADRADEMLAAGNLYERRTWRRVHQALSILLAQPH